MPSFEEILDEIRTKPTTSVPKTGKVLGELGANPSYDAAKNGTLGVPTFWVGGKLRVRSIDVLRKLGLEGEARFANAQQGGPLPSPATLESTPPPDTRKTPSHDATTQRQDRRKRTSSNSKEENAEIA
jgi:hypothetical protein